MSIPGGKEKCLSVRGFGTSFSGIEAGFSILILKPSAVFVRH